MSSMVIVTPVKDLMDEKNKRRFDELVEQREAAIKKSLEATNDGTIKVQKIQSPTHFMWRYAGRVLPRERSLSVVDKFEYIYYNNVGSISLSEWRSSGSGLKLPVLPYIRVDEEKQWQIRCLVGTLFEGFENYSSRELAEKRIEELLKGTIN